MFFKRTYREHGTNLKRAGFIFGWNWCQSIIKKLLQQKTLIDIPNSKLIQLIYNDFRCLGGIFLDNNNNVFFIYSKYTILATGGWAGCYSNCTTNKSSTGEGISFAANIGAELSDMEMVQFVPFVIKPPDKHSNNLNLHFLVTAYGIGELLRNYNIKPLTKLKIKKQERAAKEIICLSLAIDKLENIDTKYQIALRDEDLQKMPILKMRVKQMLKRLPYSQWNKRHLLIPLIELLEKEKYIDVDVAAHFTIGGIYTDSNMQSTVLGLYALGECRSGLWGAGRVYSACNQCHSDVAKLNLSEDYFKFPSNYKLNSLSKNLYKKINISKFSKEDYRIFKHIRQLFMTSLGLIRTKEGLEEAIFIADKYITHSNYKIHNLALMLKLTATSAKYRKETRGCHIRKDFPLNNKESVSYNLIYNSSNFSVNVIPKYNRKYNLQNMSIKEQINYLQN